MQKNHHSVKGVALMRSKLYQLLSTAYLYPDEEFAAHLKEGGFNRELEMCFRRLRDQEAYRRVTEIDIPPPFNGEFSTEALQSEYVRIWGHTISRECPPYETEYGNAHIYQQAQVMSDIAGFYKAFGLEISGGISERLDHISVETEFMHFLTFKEAYAAGRQERERASICLDAQKKFFSDHLGRWVPLFTRLLGKKAGMGWYREIAMLTERFLTGEALYLNVKPDEILEYHPAGREDSPFSCDDVGMCQESREDI